MDIEHKDSKLISAIMVQFIESFFARQLQNEEKKRGKGEKNNNTIQYNIASGCYTWMCPLFCLIHLLQCCTVNEALLDELLGCFPWTKPSQRVRKRLSVFEQTMETITMKRDSVSLYECLGLCALYKQTSKISV